MRGLCKQLPHFLWGAILTDGVLHKAGDAHVEDSDDFDTACFLDDLTARTPSDESWFR